MWKKNKNGAVEMKLEVKINTESRTFYTEVTHFDTVCQTSVGFSFTFEALTSRSEVRRLIMTLV